MPYSPQTDILNRLLIHVAAFNLGILLRRVLGVGTPRGLQGRGSPWRYFSDSIGPAAPS